MQKHVMLPHWDIQSVWGGEDVVLDTMGDRILYLFRKFGKDDRNEGYQRKEIVAMLNGDVPARNGKTYKLGTNESQLSRMIRGIQEPRIDILDALCDLFDTDMEWLIRGNTIGELSPPDHFFSTEANEVGAVIDTLPQDLRTLMNTNATALQRLQQELERLRQENQRLSQELDRSVQEKETLAKELESLSQQQHQDALEMVDLLERYANSMEESHRRQAIAYIANIGHRKLPRPPLAP